jgi:hypothetical protein
MMQDKGWDPEYFGFIRELPWNNGIVAFCLWRPVLAHVQNRSSG